LFDNRADATTHMERSLPFVASLPAVPMYLIDVNVFLDLMKARADADGARQLIAASWTRSIDVFVSEEFFEELRRASPPAGPDPILEFASTLPRLPRVPEAIAKGIAATLARIIFPSKATNSTLSRRDESDLLHIATAVHHAANGFI